VTADVNIGAARRQDGFRVGDHSWAREKGDAAPDSLKAIECPYIKDAKIASATKPTLV